MGKSKVLVDLKSDIISTDMVANSNMDLHHLHRFVCHCVSVIVTGFM
jgi:hypothetical protein